MWLVVVVAGTSHFLEWIISFVRKKGVPESLPRQLPFLCVRATSAAGSFRRTAVGTPHMPDTVLGRHVHGLWLVILYITYSSFYTQNRADVPFPSVP
jgi:hypothetical protein